MTLTPTTHLLRTSDVEVLQFDGLARHCNISHFITTRRGGVSTGAYASMNAGAFSGDNPASVLENRSRLAHGLGFRVERLFSPEQVHGAEVRIIDDTFLQLSPSEKTQYLQGVDGLITSVPDVCVSVTTADCVPVLLYSPDKEAVAVVHAGWRGTVKNIVGVAVGKMIQEFGCCPERILAAIGPSISREAFEVGDEVVRSFTDSGNWTNGEITHLVSRNSQTGKAHIDLWLANRFLLEKAGLSPRNIEVAGICTYLNVEDFFSARRLGIRSGRILSGIFLRNNSAL